MNSAARAPRLDDAVAPQAHDELPLATPPVELHEGDVVGRFRIGAVMGVGGHGVVYAASHVELGYPVALKVMDRYAGRDPRRRARFRREALIGARPRHRNVVAILETGELRCGSPYLVMEHVRGVELAHVLDRLGPLTPAATIDLGIQLLCAVAALAEHGIVHRDIKPQNVMLARAADGAVEVKLLDFGIVKARYADGVGPLTQEGFVLGTPQYMSPEQIRGQPLDTRSDLYAIGALLYETLTGAPPIDATRFDDVLTAALIEEPRPIAGCPPELERLITRALSKTREGRFPTPQAMADALRSVQRALDATNGSEAWARVLPALNRARGRSPAPVDAAPVRDPGRARVSELGTPEISQRYLPTPAERPSALRARRARPKLPPPWWPAVAIVAAAILVVWALASADGSPPRGGRAPVELAAPSAGK